MSRVLLTGATGLVGRQALSALLSAGHEVHAVARRVPRTDRAETRWHQADLLSGPAIVGELRPEVLVHLAWYAEHGRYWTAPENDLWRVASLSLLQAFVAAGGRRAVMAGSCAEYEWSRAVYTEDAPCLPATPYGRAKHDLHQAAEALADASSLSLCWARLFLLFGPGEDPRRFVPSIVRALLARETAQMTSGSQVRDFMHTADLGAALATLAASDVTGPVNVASGEGVSLRMLADLIAVHAGDLGGVGVGLLPDRPDEPASLVADVRRLREEVGFRPRAPLDQRIAETVEWWRQHQHASTRSGSSVRLDRSRLRPTGDP